MRCQARSSSPQNKKASPPPPHAVAQSTASRNGKPGGCSSPISFDCDAPNKVESQAIRDRGCMHEIRSDPGYRTTICRHPEAIRQTLHFLAHGRFDHDGAPALKKTDNRPPARSRTGQETRLGRRPRTARPGSKAKAKTDGSGN